MPSGSVGISPRILIEFFPCFGFARGDRRGEISPPRSHDKKWASRTTRVFSTQSLPPLIETWPPSLRAKRRPPMDCRCMCGTCRSPLLSFQQARVRQKQVLTSHSIEQSSREDSRDSTKFRSSPGHNRAVTSESVSPPIQVQSRFR